jgi:hypothetical protein
MFRKKSFLLLCLLLLFINCFPQSGNPPVKITLEKAITGDSLWITVSINAYTKPSSLMFVASLENTQAKDTFFLPVIDSVSYYCFIYPLSIRENCLLQAYFSPGIFKIAGIVNDHKRSSGIKAILITDNARVYNKEIAIKADSRFELPSLVFEKQASLVLNYTNDNKWKTHPDVAISVSPALKDFTELVFSSEIKRVNGQNAEQPGKKNIINDSLENGVKADPKYKDLKGVQVAATRKKNIEKFDDEYSTGLFKDPSERVIDCIDDNSILSYPNCINYLQIQVPGLNISTSQFGDMIVKWRGHEMKAFYIDEIPVDLEQLVGVNTADIAMLKVYPPPFFGSSSGDGGAIALYTRRGEYGSPGSKTNKWLFTIKGYAPPMNNLFNKK